LFGTELTKPVKHDKQGYATPSLYLYKRKRLVKNGIDFLNEISKLLEEFKIKAIVEIEKSKIITKSREKNVKLILRISSKLDNIIQLWEKIGYEYHKERKRLASEALLYLKFKRIFLKNKKETLKKAILKKKEEGKTTEEILQNSKKKLLHGVLKSTFYKKEQKNTDVRISLKFITPEEFIQPKTFNPTSQALWVKISAIKILNYKGWVYDFTVSHEDHNFIANGFILSNCGVRLIRTHLNLDEVRPVLKNLLEQMFRNVPSGLGSRGRVKVHSVQEFNRVLEQGARWAVERGYGWEGDLKHLEEEGCLDLADSTVVSGKAKSRGMPQLGSLGAGNHFLEIQKVDKIYNPEIARVFGIECENQITVMIHTGSRGLGHQVCSDYLREMERQYHNIISKLPDRELIYAPAGSKLADKYLKAMSCAANFAWCNRQMIVHWVRESFQNVFKKDAENLGMRIVYDVAHNIAKIEEHKVNGKKVKVYTHRKGATRAFGPGHKEIPTDYRNVGQPVLIPGSMGTASYVLVGSDQAMEETFGSTAHGAGREMSRSKAIKRYWGKTVASDLAKRGILVRAASWKVVAEEAPGAYKDIDEVARVSDKAGIGKLVARLVPIGVVKG